MVAFKRMWDDVSMILSNDSVKDFQIVEKFKSGFVVKDNDDTHFVTKDDFIDFWCNILYFNKIEKEQLIKDGRARLKYVYDIVKTLPYISEHEGTLNLTE